jgi:autotransporter-associated beta strand protein
MVTAGSIEGAGDFFLPSVIPGSTLIVGSNGLSTTVSGAIWDGCGCEPGALTKVGAGTLTLSGANTYTGVTTVAAGTLAIDGSVDSDVTVSSGGTLKGIGIMNALTVLAGGVHAPGNSIGTEFVSGNYTNQGTLEIETSPTLADLVDVTGAVDVAGGTLHLVPAVGLYGVTTTYTIVQNDLGDAVTGPFGAVTGAPFFDRSVNYAGGDSNDIDLTLTANLKAPALTFNQKQVGAALQNALGSTAPDTQALLSLLFGIGDDEAARAALDLLTGEIHAGVGGALLLQDRRFLELIAARFGLAIGGTAAPLAYAGEDPALARGPDALALLQGSSRHPDAGGAWATAFGGLDHLDSDGNGGSLDGWSGGLAGGYEAGIDEATRLGIALGYSRGGISLPSRNSTANVGTGRLAAYLSREAGPWIFGGVAEYNHTAIDTRRRVAFGGFDMTATAAYAAHQASLYGEAARAFAFGSKTVLPFVGLRYDYLRTGAFTESGAGGANLTSPGTAYQSIDSVLGIRIAGLIPVRGMMVSPSFRFAWEHAFGADAPAANLAIAGAAFAPAMTAEARDRLIVGTGLKLAVSKTTSAELTYAATIAASRISHDAGLKFGLRF